MADKTGTEQQTIGIHIRNTVFADEVAALDTDTEGLSVSADIYGKIELWTNASGVSISDLETNWTAHQSGCADGCKDWSL